MSDPFYPSKAGDPILSEHWNGMQVKLRDEIANLIRGHTHAGGDNGVTLGGEAIKDGALGVKKLAVTESASAATLSVSGNAGIGGTLSYGDGGCRTENRDDAGLRGDAGAKSGFYQTSKPVNFPPGSKDGQWWHLLDVRHSNPANNFAMQLAGHFYDQNLWFRKTTDSAAQPWHRIVAADGSTGNVAVDGALTAAGLSVSGNADVTGDVRVKGALGVEGAGLRFNNQNAADKRLWSPADGLLRWQTHNSAGAHAFEIGHQGDAAAVHLDTTGASWIGASLGIGTTTPGRMLHIQGRGGSGPFYSDVNDRPGLALTGDYPELTLFSGVNNTNHGATIRIGGYDDDTKKTHQQWVIGTSGRNCSTHLDIGFGKNDPNVHSGIRNYNGKTVMTFQYTDDGNYGVSVAGLAFGIRPAWADANFTPAPYETISTGDQNFNLRLNSNHSIFLKPKEYVQLDMPNPIRLTAAWTGFPDATTNQAEISNDVKDYKTLMIVGNKSNGGPRRVSVWDRLEVNGWIGVRRVPQVPLDLVCEGAGAGLRIKSSASDRNIHQFWDGNDNICFYLQNGLGQWMDQAGNWVHNSDVSLKENLRPLDGMLPLAMQLKPVRFSWTATGMEGVGFVAQEVEPLFPELVSASRPDSARPEIKGLSYSSFGVIAIAAIQELARKNDEQRRRYEDKLAALEERVHQWTARGAGRE